MFLMCLLAMMVAGKKLVAQEITITLEPGWNWISYPNAEAMDVASALNGFEPMEGDLIKSRYTSSKYSRGRWSGGVTHFIPGWGFMYYSNRDEFVSFVFNKPPMPTGTLSVTTGELANITSTTAACGGSAVSNDGTSILMKGVCWATHPQPTTNDSYTEDGSGPGDFTSTMTALDPETEYYVRAYAVSVKGINYGEELSFTTAQQGVLNGLFSVSENNQVCFSQGNLQYQASTNTWRFAEHQWDFVGKNEVGTVYENGVKSDNSLISSSYNGWIDLFGWGTSGYNHGAVCYQPWSTSETNSDYYAYGSYTNNLNDQTGFADWGCNPISNGGNQGDQWRTMSKEEWDYMIDSRQTTSGILYAKAMVNEINGVVILPDNWVESNYSLNNVNISGASFNGNVITAMEWSNIFENNGAVFLPAAGDRGGTHANSLGCYYSSSYYDWAIAYQLWFSESTLYNATQFGRCNACCVRLVQDVE